MTNQSRLSGFETDAVDSDSTTGVTTSESDASAETDTDGPCWCEAEDYPISCFNCWEPDP